MHKWGCVAVHAWAVPVCSCDMCGALCISVWLCVAVCMCVGLHACVWLCTYVWLC